MDAVSPLLSEENPSTWAYGQAALQVVSVTIDLKDCGAEAEREGGVEGQCRLCFAAGTPIHTSRGDVPVEQIEVGDEVLAQDRATGKLEYQPVSALTQPHHDKLLNLRVEGERDPLRPSTGHPFWVRRGDAVGGAWMDADAMQVGDRLLTMDGNWRRITAVTAVAQEQTVYNFTVANDHDYFVGETGFLVHNARNCDCFPDNPLDMNDILGFEGTPKPDGSLTPGRNKWIWDLGNMLITFEQHPYDPPGRFIPGHSGPHWHVDWPGRRHARFCPGDKFPGLP